MSTLAIILSILAAVLAVASFMPLIKKDAWWIRAFDFPRGQLVILNLAALIAGLCVWDLRNPFQAGLAILLLLALGYLVVAMFPYTPFAPRQVLSSTASHGEPDATLSLLIANVLMSNRESARLLEHIRHTDPDVILLLEPDGWWEERMRVLEETHPHALKKPLDTRYGMLLYSRLPLVDPKIEFLVNDHIPSMHGRVRLPSGRLVWLHALHPDPPAPTETDSSTERDVELIVVGQSVKEHNEPTVVAGDLNDVAWSYTTTLFQKISGLLDPRRGRGFYNTFNAKNPLLRWPLDHVFHSDHFTLVTLRRLPAFGSDHFPVYIKLHLQPEKQDDQKELVLDRDDARHAQEKLGRLNHGHDGREVAPLFAFINGLPLSLALSPLMDLSRTASRGRGEREPPLPNPPQFVTSLEREPVLHEIAHGRLDMTRENIQ